MRRLLFPLLIIGVTVSLFSIGSGAFFSDTQTSTGNSFTAGEFTLTVGTSFSVPAEGGIYPGQSGTESIELTNNSSVEGFISTIDGISVADNGGTLSSRLNITVCFAATAAAGCGESGFYTGTLAGFANCTTACTGLTQTLAAGANTFLTFDWEWPYGTDDVDDNAAQGDITNLTFDVTLQQTNPNP